MTVLSSTESCGSSFVPYISCLLTKGNHMRIRTENLTGFNFRSRDFLVCCAVWCCGWIQAFRRAVLPSSSGCLNNEDGGSTVLRKVCTQP